MNYDQFIKSCAVILYRTSVLNTDKQEMVIPQLQHPLSSFLCEFQVQNGAQSDQNEWSCNSFSNRKLIL